MPYVILISVRIYFLIFFLSINFPASGSQGQESPFEYNCRWYQNDFKWWDIWHEELYENFGKNETKDIYNAGKVIESVERLMKWVLPDKSGQFEEFLDFYDTVKGEVEKGNLRRYEIRTIQKLLKDRRKEFIKKFLWKNIKADEWIRSDLLDKSVFEKVETVPSLPEARKTGARYVAHQYGKIFHKLNCDKVKDIKESDRIYFKTKRRGLSMGFKPCRDCKP